MSQPIGTAAERHCERCGGPTKGLSYQVNGGPWLCQACFALECRTRPSGWVCPVCGAGVSPSFPWPMKASVTRKKIRRSNQKPMTLEAWVRRYGTKHLIEAPFPFDEIVAYDQRKV